MVDQGRIRVLVVDDSAVARRVLARVLESDPEIEIAGFAISGVALLSKLDVLKPDVVILDVEMPDMDGLTALRHIRAKSRNLPVIMFSSLTEKGASTTVQALLLGANDYLPKPKSATSLEESIDIIRKELIPKIKALGRKKTLPPQPTRPQPSTPSAPLSFKRRAGANVEIIAIGSSTGGPNALAYIIKQLPSYITVPIVIVQHMPPVFTTMLAKHLQMMTSMPVNEAYEGAQLNPGSIWIAPGDYHMVVERKGIKPYLHLLQTEPENFCRPSVDPLFRSVAKLYGPTVLGVILTGMGHDGLDGTRQIKETGGFVIAQDEATSVVWGMPGAVVQAGLADLVLPLEKIPVAITNLVLKKEPLSQDLSVN